MKATVTTVTHSNTVTSVITIMHVTTVTTVTTVTNVNTVNTISTVTSLRSSRQLLLPPYSFNRSSALFPPTLTKMSILVSPILYLPSDTLTMENWLAHWHSSTNSLTWGRACLTGCLVVCVKFVMCTWRNVMFGVQCTGQTGWMV